MPGPLPTGTARRRNAPTIAGTVLPSEGRQGSVPKPPRWRKLGPSGKAWWAWAWRTPQAAAWPDSMIDFVARRAALEDDLRTLDEAPVLDLEDVLDVEPSERLRAVEAIIRRLHSLAGGRLAVMREMRELDNRLGLNPKALGELRWTIAADEVGEKRAEAGARPSGRRLLAVDPGAVAGA